MSQRKKGRGGLRQKRRSICPGKDNSRKISQDVVRKVARLLRRAGGKSDRELTREVAKLFRVRISRKRSNGAFYFEPL